MKPNGKWLRKHIKCGIIEKCKIKEIQTERFLECISFLHFIHFQHRSRVESEQRHLDERTNASQLSTMDKQDDRHLAEARQDKLRYLEEVHSAQRKMNDLQAHLKLLETKLADKDVEIRLLQEKKSS